MITLNQSGNTNVINCTITNNYLNGSAVIYNASNQAIVTNSIIRDNGTYNSNFGNPIYGQVSVSYSNLDGNFPVDNNGNIDTYLWDEDHDGKFDWYYFDDNENEIPEVRILISSSWDEYDFDIHYYDDDEDGTYDMVGYDFDNDQVVDEFQEI